MSGNPYSGPGNSGRNRMASDGGPQGVQRSYASQLKEHEPLFNTYEHLQGLPRGDSALTMLRKVASMVKPIMRKRSWRVDILAEFLPPEQNLLGLNINKGYKICIRLRYHNNPDLFLPIEQVVDTMLHELSHNVWGDHDSNFHKLWDELRDEYEVLVRKGYTGEGFLSEGKKLGGSDGRMPPQHEMRRLARASAEKRKAQGALSHGSGQRLGGAPLHAYGGDIRQVIADQAARRNQIDKGCASGRKDAGRLSDESSQKTFKTKAEEDDANNRAIAQALFELMEQEEAQKLDGSAQGESGGAGLTWSPEYGLYNASVNLPQSSSTPTHPSEEEQMAWALRDSMDPNHGASDPLTTSGTTLLTSDELHVTKCPPPIPLAFKPRPQGWGDQSASNSVQGGRADREAKHKRPMDQPGSTPPSREAVMSQSCSYDEDLIDLTGSPARDATIDDQWACEVCTCINPTQFLACDACGVERPQSTSFGKGNPRPIRPASHPASSKPRLRPEVTERWKIEPRQEPETLGWLCTGCGAFMEHKWWTCSACGRMKMSS